MTLMYPHQLFSYIFHKHPVIFNKLVNDGEVEGFWNRVEDSEDPWLVDNVVTTQPGWKTSAIPLLLYGDGA
eukprot:1982069-Alexandrium_andersonii.AAC.1